MKIYHIPAAPPLYTNTFLLVGENGLAAAVDPAAGAQEYLRLLEQEGARLTHILLTHGHYDHVGAVEELQRKTGAKVWLAPQDACGGELFPFTTPDNAYADGEEIRVDTDLAFRVIATPGHSAGRLPAVRRSAVQRRHAVRGGRGPYGPARRQLGHTAEKPEKAVRRSDGKRAGPARPRGVFHHGPGTGEQSVSAILTKR